MWIIDIRHWLNKQQDGPAEPPLKMKVKKITEIITYATACDRGLTMEETPKCWRRPQRKPCNGTLQINFESDDRIHWFCPECEDEGIIDGWQGLIWDLREGMMH